jgi:hypothetical protein
VQSKIKEFRVPKNLAHPKEFTSGLATMCAKQERTDFVADMHERE